MQDHVAVDEGRRINLLPCAGVPGLDPDVGVVLPYGQIVAVLAPGAAHEASDEPRGDAHRAEDVGGCRGVVAAVAGLRPEEEMIDCRIAPVRLNVKRVGKAARLEVAQEASDGVLGRR